eukprot:gene16570-11780_t
MPEFGGATHVVECERVTSRGASKPCIAALTHQYLAVCDPGGSVRRVVPVCAIDEVNISDAEAEPGGERVRHLLLR